MVSFLASPCSAIGSGSPSTNSMVRMVNSSLTVREGETVSVCVVATLSDGESVEVGLTSSSDQGRQSEYCLQSI